MASARRVKKSWLGQGISDRQPLYLGQLFPVQTGPISVRSHCVHAGSRRYVFAQSSPVLFPCGSGEHCLVLMVGKSIFYSVGFQCYVHFVCGLYYKVSFSFLLILRKIAFYRFYMEELKKYKYRYRLILAYRVANN